MTTQELLCTLLRFKSVTPKDDGAFAFIKTYLHTFEAIELDLHGVKNLFLIKRFGEGPHLCFAGHIDVVPAGEGWQSDPFVPKIENGIIYARGAQDMKSGVCAFLRACHDTTHFDGTLSILLTSDEEGDAKYGTIEMLKHLKQQALLPDFTIVAEPTSQHIFGDAIKIGRRGSINGVIEILGKQGHAAYPQKAINPIHQIAPLLSHLAGHYLDEGDASFEPSQIVITDIRGGMEVTNVTPAKLKIMFNVRNSPKTTKEHLHAYIEQVLQGLDYTLSLSQSAKPFITKPDTRLVNVVQNALIAITKNAPELSTAGGTSDARFFGEFGIETIECGVLNDTIHAVNECVKLEDVEALVDVFTYIIHHISQKEIQ